MSEDINFACLGQSCPNSCCGPFLGTGGLKSTRTPGELGKIWEDPYFKGVSEKDRRSFSSESMSIFAYIRLLDQDVRRLREGGFFELIEVRETNNISSFYLKTRKDGTCLALSENKLCTIYDHRPTLCRAFPFYIDMFAGLCLLSSCPGVGAGENGIDEHCESIQSVLKLYTFWIDEIENSLKETNREPSK